MYFKCHLQEKLLRMLLTGLSRFSTGNLRLSMMMSVSMMIERWKDSVQSCKRVPLTRVFSLRSSEE